MHEFKVDVDFIWAIIFLFLLFWLQSGWYRVDCALGIKRACEHIQAEYAAADARQRKP